MPLGMTSGIVMARCCYSTMLLTDASHVELFNLNKKAVEPFFWPVTVFPFFCKAEISTEFVLAGLAGGNLLQLRWKDGMHFVDGRRTTAADSLVLG